jgi:hypothetical protein
MAEKRKTTGFSWRSTNLKRALGRTRRIWEDNINIELKAI